MLMCSHLPNNFQESLSWLRSGTWSWIESLSTGTHSTSWTNPGNSQGITAVNTHLTLNRAGGPSHIFSSTQDAFQLHLSVAQNISWCAYAVCHKTETVSISSTGIPKNWVKTSSLCIKITSCRWAVVTCSVHVCSVIGTMWTIHNLEKHHLTWNRVWGLVYSEASKYRSAVDRGFRMLIYNRERAAAVRSFN